jgi:zinc protease
MRIVLEVDHEQPVVGVASVVDCGSAQDPPGHEGLAHLIEHLTFRAKHDGKVQLGNSLDFAGAGSRNAFTEHDLTTYFEVGPREALGELLRLEGARLSMPLAGIDADVFDAEREVVRNELLQRDENGQVTGALVALSAALYPPGHPYARPAIGSQTSLWALRLSDAVDFVQRCYQPRNFTVVISGDFDPASIGKVLDTTFPLAFLDAPAGGPVPPPHRLDPVAPPPPDPTSDDSIHWVKAPSESPKLYIGWTLPRGFDADAYLQDFMAGALQSEAMRGGFEHDIVAVQTSLDRGKFGTTLIAIVVLRTGSDPKGSAGHVLRVLPHLEQLSTRWFEQMKARAVVDLAQSTDSIEDRLTQRAQLVHLTGDLLTYSKHLTAIQKLERRQLEAYAWTWLRAGRARVVFLKPDDWDVETREVGGGQQVFAPSDDLPMKLAPGALRNYLHGPSATMRTMALDNGLEVVLVQTRAAIASVTVALKSGSATATPLGAADLADALSYNAATLDPSDWGIRLSRRNELDTTIVQALAAGGNVENALAVTAGYLTSVRVPKELPRYWERDVLPVFGEFELKSSARSVRAFLDSTFADSSYPRRPVVADYRKLSALDAKGWIERAYRPGNAVAVVVSDLGAAESGKLVRSAFSGWTGSSASPDAPFVAPELKVGALRTFRIERPAAKQTELIIGCAARPQDAHDAIALELLGDRLRTRLYSFARGRSGGSYSFNGQTKVSRQLSHTKVWGLVDDRNLTRVVALARKELNELLSLRVSNDELDRMKWHLGIINTVGYRRSEDLGRLVAEVRAANLPLDLVENFPELLQEVTSADVARMAAVCRTTATLGLVGDPAVIDKAFRATQLVAEGVSQP